MPGRMGNKNITIQSLKIVKIDTVHNLIYIKGSVPGVDNQYCRVTDAVRKLWHQKAFPENATVPFPTWFDGNVKLERELIESGEFKESVDPFRRTKRERE